MVPRRGGYYWLCDYNSSGQVVLIDSLSVALSQGKAGYYEGCSGKSGERSMQSKGSEDAFNGLEIVAALVFFMLWALLGMYHFSI